MMPYQLAVKMQADILAQRRHDTEVTTSEIQSKIVVPVWRIILWVPLRCKPRKSCNYARRGYGVLRLDAAFHAEGRRMSECQGRFSGLRGDKQQLGQAGTASMFVSMNCLDGLGRNTLGLDARG
jgi:hypothetical protein